MNGPQGFTAGKKPRKNTPEQIFIPLQLFSFPRGHLGRQPRKTSDTYQLRTRMERNGTVRPEKDHYSSKLQSPDQPQYSATVPVILDQKVRSYAQSIQQLTTRHKREG
ncbi:hypothetical protein IB274_13685 [Pseudomonas sp. PDM18]|uniref:hypothetical protein n=1 Tax=Pseudomonas sp. PDM18 TaxID=2769253 RepID=UPI0017846400|nr:hypothetical protein [Pseudomonas sp. PDM18]MBD9677758.1 hypothetical protein [Pseudomonas sp. PDM18]